MEQIFKEIRYAFRILTRNKLFAIVAILTLAVGIGANSAIFSAVYRILLKPLPYKDPDRLVFALSIRKTGAYMTMSPLDYQDVSRSGLFEKSAALTNGTMDLTGNGEPERLNSANVTPDFFNVLGVQPVSGRAFLPQEGKYGAEKVVILSHGLWKRRFASDPKIVGSTILLDGRHRTVIGIAPPEIDYPATTDIWTTLAFSPDELDATQRGARWIKVIGRLSPGVTLAQAQERMKTLAADLAKKYPDSNENVGGTVQPFHGFIVRNTKPALLVLWGSVGFVLLIACVNVTNLLLSQAARRETEFSIRMALGAGRLGLYRQFIVESLVLSLSASVLGLLIGIWCTDLLVKFGSDTLPALKDLKLDLTVLLFTIGISILTGLLIGLVPALQNIRGTWSRIQSGSRVLGRNRIRRSLAVIEIAVALILLSGAGLLIKSFHRLNQVDPGFKPDGVLSFEIALPDSRYSTPHQTVSFYSQFLERIDSHQQVDSTAAVFGLPLTQGYGAASSFELIGKPQPKDDPVAGLRVVTPKYFQTMGIPVLQGRSFTDLDKGTSGNVVILSESAAKAYWPNENPLGQKIRVHVSLVARDSVPATIVGIVGDVRFEGLEENPQPDLYIPHTQQELNAMMVVARTSSDPASLVPMVREELKQLDADLPLSSVKTMHELIGSSLGQRRFTMLLLAAFAGIGLFLAALGTYGVLSFQVAQRTREIGIRMALGAHRNDVLKLILHEGGMLSLAGALIGFVGILATSRFLQSLVFGISTLDVSTFAWVVFLLAAVAMIACYLPARRATKVDPIVTLRYE